MLPFIYTVTLGMIGLGWVFIRYLILQDRGPKEPARALWAAGVFGLLGVIISIIAEYQLIPQSVFDDPSQATLRELVWATFFIGIIEEGAKSLPLAFFIYRKRYFNEMTDGVIYFGIAGMVFGVVENIGYTLAMGSVVGVLRMIISPFIHAAFCALFGWSLAWVKVKRRTPLYILMGAVIAAGAHMLYDLGFLYGRRWSVLGALSIAIVMNSGVFLLLRLAQRTDARLGLAAEGDNFFCRQCGAPNPQHFLYCTTCGKKT